MIKNKFYSFVILLVVYLLTACIGIELFICLSFDYRISLFLADVFATVIVFIFSMIFRNASVYDPYWSVQPMVILGGFALTKGLNLLGMIVVCVVFFWGLRLTANWAYTFKNLDSQDWRYTLLQNECGIFFPFINFVGIHLVPTIIVFFCVLPGVVVINEGVEFNLFSLPFFGLSICAVIIQGIADYQMQKFRNSGTGGFIRTGLWKHGRHPNYMGEILMWWGFGFGCVVCMPNRLFLLLGALINTVLFFTVSIPMAEKRQAKKPGFEEYKQQTRLFI